MSKATWVGAPAIFQLELECKHLNKAFGSFGCYLVGSAIEKYDHRDVDVRFIMEDVEFDKLFPNAGDHWDADTRWLLLTTMISERLSKITNLKIDFQFQKQTHANKTFDGPRHALGLNIIKTVKSPPFDIEKDFLTEGLRKSLEADNEDQ